MTFVIIALASSFAVLIALLVIAVMASRLPIILRGLLTIMAITLMFVTYWGVSEIRGLPSDTALPAQFRMHWARILEPNKISGENGSIFLWVEALDEDNYPSGLPRAYQLPYTPELADAVEQALAAISDGEEVAGQIEEGAAEISTAEQLAIELDGEQNSQNNTALGERVIAIDFGDIRFGAVPAPITPEKPSN